MLKTIQFKIILIFFLIGIILISGIGIAYINSINVLNTQIESGEIQNLEQVTNYLQGTQQNNVIILVITSLAFIICAIVISLFLSKFVIYPINKLIKSAEKIAEDEQKHKGKIKLIKEKKNNEVGNIEEVIDMMTVELKEKLSEVSTQKNQIETILLHMTDGIIAFNMEGEIILINPAAKKFLSIRPEDITFEDIFKKFNLGINMEKIIYLENWTSTEQRIQVEDKFVNVFFAPFKNEEDRPNGVIAVIQDITEHVKLDNMQKEFVADVSHELKTPITSIMGYADTLLEADYDKETRDKFLTVIASEARRMARLVTESSYFIKV